MFLFYFFLLYSVNGVYYVLLRVRETVTADYLNLDSSILVFKKGCPSSRNFYFSSKLPVNYAISSKSFN